MIPPEPKALYIRELLQRGKRADGRSFLSYRPIGIETGIIPNAEGSALASIGATKVLAGIKFDVMEPFKDRPEEGIIIVNAEFAPLAHPTFEAGPPSESAIELARVVDRGIRSAEVVDVSKLFLEERRVLALFIDLWVIDHCGNLIDCAALAAMAALTNTKIPKYESGAIIRGEYAAPLEVSRRVVTCTFERINGTAILDATDEEEQASEGRLTIATCDKETICALQKSGPAGFKKEELLNLIDTALQKGEELRRFT